MTLTLDAILRSADLEPAETQAIRHAFVREHEDSGTPGINANSTDEEILAYTCEQSAKPRIFPAVPPRLWVVFMPEGGDRARLWSVLENCGEVSNDGALRTFDLVATDHLADLRNRLVIGWRSPRTWRLNGPTAAGYPVMEIADAQPVPFPGFDRLLLDRPQSQAVMREHRYAAWRTARRAYGSAGTPTRSTATAATSSCGASIPPVFVTRSCACSTLRLRRASSTRPRATSSSPSTRGGTG